MAPAVIVLMAISTVMAMKANQAQNDALDAANAAAADQAELDILELDRQRDFVDRKAATDKAEGVRISDATTASMLVAMADMGGIGTVNEARLDAEVGFYEGIDLARIEGNRNREGESLRAKQVFAKNNALNIITQNKAQQKVNTYNFLSSSASKAASAFGSSGGGGGAKPTATGTKGGTYRGSASTYTPPMGRNKSPEGDFVGGTF